jgi:hypothetical protein
MDTYRQPGKVIDACEMLTPIMARFALAGADPLKRYPIVVPTHKPCLFSRNKFDKFLAFFKKVLEICLVPDISQNSAEGIGANTGAICLHFRWVPVRVMLTFFSDSSGQGRDWHHTVLPAEYTTQCLSRDSAGNCGLSSYCVKRSRKGGGYIMERLDADSYETKPENYRAMVDAVMKYGWYDRNISPRPKDLLQTNNVPVAQGVLTPWEVKKRELGGVQGDEDLIRIPWETIEGMAFNWLWSWAW